MPKKALGVYLAADRKIGDIIEKEQSQMGLLFSWHAVRDSNP